MAALEIKIDVLAPEHKKVLEFSGYKPTRFLKIIPSLMKETMRLSSSKFFEDKIKWDVSAEDIVFYGEWRGKDEKDGRTTLWVSIKAQGSQNKNEKNGKIMIELRGEMKTKFKYSNILDKALYLTYSRLFYSDLRRRYATEAVRDITTIENELKKELEAMVK